MKSRFAAAGALAAGKDQIRLVFSQQMNDQRRGSTTTIEHTGYYKDEFARSGNRWFFIKRQYFGDDWNSAFLDTGPERLLSRLTARETVSRRRSSLVCCPPSSEHRNEQRQASHNEDDGTHRQFQLVLRSQAACQEEHTDDNPEAL